MLSNMAISSFSVFKPHLPPLTPFQCKITVHAHKIRANFAASSSIFFILFYFIFPPCAVAAL
jgi:hypothetical protein